VLLLAYMLHSILHALSLTGAMSWEILWALILGFILSAIVQAVVRRKTVTKLLGEDKPKTLVIAMGLGAASSSCSYAAVALARSLWQKGASFTAAMAFEIASTNLVIELGIILALLIAWQFTLAEFIGGPIMILLIAIMFRLFLRSVYTSRKRAIWFDGGPCCYGYERTKRGNVLAASKLTRGRHVSITHICHGMGCRAQGCYSGPAHRRSCWCMGS